MPRTGQRSGFVIAEARESRVGACWDITVGGAAGADISRAKSGAGVKSARQQVRRVLTRCV